ncbi:MAG: ABC transporter permease subunit [Myxococcota bacterium]
MSALSNIGIVAQFDLYESLRSRRALTLILLYGIISIGASALFCIGVNGFYENLDRSGPGAAAVLDSPDLPKQFGQWFDIEVEVARELLRIPALALFYLMFATYALPLVVLMTSAEAIVRELSSGSSRFILFRTQRLSWVLGKLTGQGVLMMIGILFGAGAAFTAGWLVLDRFEPALTFWWLMRMSLRAGVIGFAYLGLALAVSQVVNTPASARGLALASAFGIWLAEVMLSRSDNGALEALSHIFPSAHDLTLFHPSLAVRAGGMLALVGFGAVTFGLGYLRFARRDT